ncbi:uncharacterized protein EDB93DRAFT_1281036 [Suillus bovinus]|uniref:uncharacterized protein n=1 Tax=Suillus bovinus TaxID=48563 RepID=UPI001B87944A|nr:uncharacterized protein EDB93DRAFT_1281036 [Suillus bovinus]KAG2147853.1 hypothetical protein EDB93DRAFT_1281036 [Suillus bovinus]
MYGILLAERLGGSVLPDVKQTVEFPLHQLTGSPESPPLGSRPMWYDLPNPPLISVGDPSPFTTAEFVLGEGSKQAFLDPSSCHSPISFSSIRPPEDRLRFFTASDLHVAIGPYSHAMDIFGDGSISLMHLVLLYWHADRHINILARTSQDGAWILLGADSAHHPDLITGKMQVACSVDATTGVVTCAHQYKAVADENIRRMRSLLEISRVQVLVAHDIVWYEQNKGKEVFLPYTIPPLV